MMVLSEIAALINRSGNDPKNRKSVWDFEYFSTWVLVADIHPGATIKSEFVDTSFLWSASRKWPLHSCHRESESMVVNIGVHRLSSPGLSYRSYFRVTFVSLLQFSIMTAFLGPEPDWTGYPPPL
jgi:hypothetical protein